MAKALVFEGCPACSSGLGFDLGQGDVATYAQKSLYGGAIGAGSVIVVDMFMPKILPTLSPTLRAVVTGGLLFATAYYLREKQPDVATGIALGGGGIVLYKLIASLLGKIQLAAPPLKGLDYAEEEELVEVEEGAPMGVIIPEYGQEEIIIE